MISNATLGRKLPEVLAIEEIKCDEASIDLSKRQEGDENRALIENLVTVVGLRCERLVILQLSHVCLEKGFLMG